MSKTATRDPALDELFARRGAITAVATELGISTAAVSTWRYVPTRRREEVARILGVEPDALPVRPRKAAS